jgi:hypothetical protein
MPGPLGCGPLRRCFFTQILGNHGDRGSDHHRSGTGGTTTSNRSPRALVFDSALIAATTHSMNSLRSDSAARIPRRPSHLHGFEERTSVKCASRGTFARCVHVFVRPRRSNTHR